MLDSILQGCLAAAPHPLNEQTAIKSFRIIKESSSHGTVIAMPTHELAHDVRLKDAVARLDLTTPYGPISGILIETPNAEVTQRISNYDAQDYILSLEPQAGDSMKAMLTGVENRIDLIRGIIEAMRQTEWLNENANSFNQMRWGYVSSFPLIDDTQCNKVKYITVSPARTIPNQNTIFSIRRIEMESFPQFKEIDMCFFIGLRHTKPS